MENDSFELLSSMSPKLKGRQKTVKKAIKILALKRHIRRSSIYDKGPTVNNEDLSIIDGSTSSSSSSSNKRNIISQHEIKQGNVIVIDSTESEDDDNYRVGNVKLFHKHTPNQLKDNNVNTTKVVRIQEWLNNVSLSEKKEDLTFFSQVSTIYGNDVSKLDMERDGVAASSTFNENLIKRFDELFVSKTNELKNKRIKDQLLDDSFSVDINSSLRSKLQKGSPEHESNVFDKIKKIPVIDETLLTSDESDISKSLNSPKRLLNMSGLASERRFITERKKNGKLDEKSIDNTPSDSGETETLLDSLYGEKWRLKISHVLPVSEPKRKPINNNKKKVLAPNTDRAPKTLKERKQDVAPKKLNFDRLKTPVQSPWMDKLKHLVDSDSDSKSERSDVHEGLGRVKTKLNFCDTPQKINDSDEENHPQKINFEGSLSDSLEDRLAKKMNNFKIPTKTTGGRKNNNNNKKTSSNENSNRIDANIKPDYKKIQNGNNYKEKNVMGRKDEKIGKNNKDKKIGKNNKENVPVNKNIDQIKSKKLEINKKPSSKKIENKAGRGSVCSLNSSDEIEISSDEEYDKEITRMYEIKRKSIRPPIEGCYSFLESLSGNIPITKCDVTARIFRTSFKTYRDSLTKKLFSLYNEKVFDKAIPSDTEIEWNDKLRNTAGLCYCKKITHKDGRVDRKVKIALSSKVLDSPDRLRDTLIHEMCHAGTWIINQISNGHGVYWKNWAYKAMSVFPELPPIKRCHTYQINTKYTYKCTGCGYSFGRHTKSLNTERKRCGLCYGKFEVLINKTTKSGEKKSVPVTPKKELNGFALFVKENYALFKEPSKTHGDVMKLLGQKFSELKVKN